MVKMQCIVVRALKLEHAKSHTKEYTLLRTVILKRTQSNQNAELSRALLSPTKPRWDAEF